MEERKAGIRALVGGGRDGCVKEPGGEEHAGACGGDHGLGSGTWGRRWRGGREG